MGKLGEGTFSEVLRVRNRRSGKYFALKRFKKHFKSVEEIECLREIQALRRLNHNPNIIQLEEVILYVRAPSDLHMLIRYSDAKYGVLSLAFELMDANLYEVLSKKGAPPIHEQRAKWVMWQIMKAMDFVHSKGIFHRDIKPENILVRGDVHGVPFPFPNPNPSSPHHSIFSFPLVKLADFGSCRGIHSRMPYTEYIATRWYRSPECLMFDGVYTYKMDIWGIGCVFFELITKIPLFPGDDEVDQLHKIHNVLGTPTERALKVMVTAGQQAIEESENKQISSSSSEPGSSKSNRNIFKRPFQFPSAKGCGIRAAFPPHILYGAQRVPPKTASTLPGYNPNDYPGITDECVNLIELLLQYDPEGRPTARQTLKHPWMKECRDLELHEKQQQQLQQPSSSILEAVTTSSIPANGAPGNATSPTEVSKEAASKEPKARRVKAQERAPAVGGIHEENSNGATATSPTKPPAFPNTQNAATNGNANWPKNTRKPAPQVNSNKMPPPMNIAPSTLPPTMEPNGTGKPTKQPSTLDANNISNPLSRVRVPAPARMGSDINQSLPRGPRQNSIEPTGLTQSTTGPNGLMLPKTLVGPQVVAPNKPGLPQPDIRRAASIRRPAPGQPVTLPRLQPQASTQDQISIDEPTSLVSSKLVSLGSQSQINAENGSRTQLQLQGEAISRSQTQMNATAVDEASANSETSAMEVVANNLASTLQVSETLSTETPTSAQVIAMSLEQAEVALAEESQGGTSVQTETNHTVSDTSNESNYKVTSGDAAPTVDVAIPEPAVENLATVSEETAQTVPALT